jgi:TIR domain/Protein of unknown function (DUF3298)
METDQPLIFVSYAKPDGDRVLPFFDHLTSQGLNLWIDVRCLKPGQNWDFEIRKALNKASLILIFISNNSYERRGYLQRELRLALDKRNEKLIDDIYVIPVLLDDDAPVPEQIQSLHFTRASNSNCNAEIEDAIRHQLTRLGEQIEETQTKSRVRWTSLIYREAWNGAPGYEAEFELLRFSSSHYPKISEITDVLRGILTSEIMSERLVMLEIPSEHLNFNFGQEKWRRINTYEARCGKPIIVGRVISLQYNIDSYRAGGAHPCLMYKTFCYLIEPVAPIKSLEQIFTNPERAFSEIQTLVRQQLLEHEIGAYDDESEWMLNGTKNWEDFSSFVFDETGIVVLFYPYKVAAYGFGPQSVKIGYSKIVHLMQPVYISALGIEHVAWESKEEQSRS